MKTRFVYLSMSFLILAGINAHAQDDNRGKTVTRGATGIHGDLDGDGRVDVADVVTLVDLVMNAQEYEEGDQPGMTNPDLASLSKKLVSLELRIDQIPTLEASQEIKDITAEISDIKETISKFDGEPSAVEIEALAERIAAVEKAIEKASEHAITGVALQETLDCVVGTTQQPGFNPGILAAYVSEKKTQLPEFPISGPDYNVCVDGDYLKARELSPSEDDFRSIPEDYTTNETGNAGKLYFTLSPNEIDATKCQFDLISTIGMVFPGQLSNIRPSDEKALLYEADVTMTRECIEWIEFDCTKFGYQNMWDAGSQLTGEDQDADSESGNMFGRFQYLIKSAIKGSIQNLLSSSLEILQDFYNGTYQLREKLQRQALRISWDDGEYDVLSGFDITSVTINPLNWKQMFTLTNLNMPWSVSNYEKSLGKIVQAIKTSLPSATDVSLKSVSMDGDNPKMTVSAGDSEMLIDITKEVYDAVGNGMQLSTLESKVNATLKPYQTLANHTPEMARVISYLNTLSGRAITEEGGNVAWNAVEPILLFENAEGISRLYPYMTINGDGATTFIMTSMTEEYIVPIYYKYIAVVQNGKVLDCHTFDGKEKMVKFSLPMGESEIIYQASDFQGNIVTKRYPVTRNK